jgi:hypothetical protein
LVVWVPVPELLVLAPALLEPVVALVPELLVWVPVLVPESLVLAPVLLEPVVALASALPV